MRIAKFLATGMIGLTVNLGSYYALSQLGVPYLLGSVGAFLLAMGVGFVLQKYWTFADHSVAHMHTQLAAYGAVTLSNLVVNTLMVFVLVEYAQTHLLLAQAVSAGLVALASYMIYCRVFDRTS